MLYLNKDNLHTIGTDWSEIIETIFLTLRLLRDDETVQPIKPYLRFNDRTNRIIAMPAYVGGEIRTAGIKWIASFPKNIQRGLSRAHSVTVLNDADTGNPICLINATLISGIRTAAVSGVMARAWFNWNRRKFRLGIVGFGPIGQLHLQMMRAVFPGEIESVAVFDLNPVFADSITPELLAGVKICNSWEEAYLDADVFITCTASNKTYIDKPPKKGSLQMNISLRDYLPGCRRYMDIVIVDDWDEVCRENTDIERMHLEEGLNQSDTFDLASAVLTDSVKKNVGSDAIVMFNPMGMAIFDVALAKYFYIKAQAMNVGITLPV